MPKVTSRPKTISLEFNFEVSQNIKRFGHHEIWITYHYETILSYLFNQNNKRFQRQVQNATYLLVKLSSFNIGKI